MNSIFTIDVEDWFNILDDPVVPEMTEWDTLESRLEQNLNVLLEILEKYNVKATLFWLGWFAERHPNLVKTCVSLGHEIACHLA